MAGQSEHAMRKAGEAAFKQFEMDKMFKRLEKRYLSKEVRFYGGYTVQIANALIKRRVVYQWTFE